MNRKIVIAGLLILVVASLFSGCKRENTNKTDDENYEMDLYFIDKNETKVTSEKYRPKATKSNALIEELLEIMEAGPKDLSNKKVLPDDIVVTYNLSKEGQLTLDFDEKYDSINKITEILCRAAIVKTFCQVDGVESVDFKVGGQPLMLSGDKAVGFMKAEDFVDNTGGETNFYQNADMTLFFADKTGKYLKELHVSVIYDGTIPMEQLVLERLIDGPQSIEGADLNEIYPTIPKGTKLIKASVKDTICYVDFNEAFLEKRSEITDSVAIYSIVNSLAEMSSISKVQFTINGKQVSTYRESMEFNAPFERNLDIVR